MTMDAVYLTLFIQHARSAAEDGHRLAYVQHRRYAGVSEHWPRERSCGARASIDVSGFSCTRQRCCMTWSSDKLTFSIREIWSDHHQKFHHRSAISYAERGGGAQAHHPLSAQVLPDCGRPESFGRELRRPRTTTSAAVRKRHHPYRRHRRQQGFGYRQRSGISWLSPTDGGGHQPAKIVLQDAPCAVVGSGLIAFADSRYYHLLGMIECAGEQLYRRDAARAGGRKLILDAGLRPWVWRTIERCTASCCRGVTQKNTSPYTAPCCSMLPGHTRWRYAEKRSCSIEIIRYCRKNGSDDLNRL